MIHTTTVEKATLYEAYRLPYAEELAGDLLARVGPVEVVADIGAGTGQLARLFVGGGRKIWAVEPDAAMRQMADAVLVHFPGIRVIAGMAEQTTLAGHSVDLIVVGNAFHRFKPDACAEFRRILKAEGWVALVSYAFTDRAYTDMLFSQLATLKAMAARQERSRHGMPVEMLFGKGQRETLRYPQSHREDWTGFWGAARAGIEAPDSEDLELARFETINRQVFDRFAVDGIIEIAYETRVMFGQLG